MAKRNLFLLASVAAASLFLGGCATTATSTLKTAHDEFSAIDRADGIKYAPTEYAQAEVNIYKADEECAEEAWLDLRECEEYLGIARAKMDNVRKKIADGRRPAPKKAEAPAPSPPAPAPMPAPAPKPVPAPVPETAPEPVVPPSAAPVVAPAPAEAVTPARKEIRAIVYFDFDRSRIRKGDTRKLKDVSDYLKANPAAKVKIEGHTCSIGTSEYNLGLSDRRADSARKYLTNKMKVSPDNIETVGYGEEKPAKPNDTKKGRQLNRRAEIVIAK